MSDIKNKTVVVRKPLKVHLKVSRVLTGFHSEHLLKLSSHKQLPPCDGEALAESSGLADGARVF